MQRSTRDFDTVEATSGHAIEVQSNTLADLSIYVSADVIAHGMGFAGMTFKGSDNLIIGVSGGATNVVSVDTDVTVSGDIGIELISRPQRSHVSTDVVEGTGGTAIVFNSLSAEDMLWELEDDRQRSSADIIGSGSDRLDAVRRRRTAGIRSIWIRSSSGFSKIVKEDATT